MGVGVGLEGWRNFSFYFFWGVGGSRSVRGMGKLGKGEAFFKGGGQAGVYGVGGVGWRWRGVGVCVLLPNAIDCFRVGAVVYVSYSVKPYFVF